MLSVHSRLAIGALACSALVSSALAQAVRIVTPAGDLDFADLQPAVDAAAEGAVLLVAEGSYGAVSIDGKSLSIFAVPGADVEVAGAVEIANLLEHQVVVIDGLDFTSLAFGATSATLTVDACQGFVRFQDCTIPGGTLVGDFDCDPFDAGAGAKVTASRNVAFLACELEGTEGEYMDPFFYPDCLAGSSGPGLHAVQSRVALYDCVIRGAEGGNAGHFSAPGARGIEADEAELYASGGEVHGGRGGNAVQLPGEYARGGDAVWLSAESVFDAVDCDLFVGFGTPPGELVTGTGFYNPLPTVARSIHTDSVVPAGTALSVSYSGEPFDLVWPSLSAGPGHQFLAGFWGVWLTHYPNFIPKSPLGVASASGDLSYTLHGTQVAPGSAHRRFVLQTLVAATWDHRFLSGARHVLILSTTEGPDCNGNGASDFVDIVTAASLDTNHNLIPDECEP